MRKCFLVEYNQLEYRYSLDLQQRIRAIKENERKFDNFLLVLQHNPVFTVGKKGSREDILATEQILESEGIDVVDVRRGGEITYHGPGQMVGYLLLNLAKLNISVDQFVWKMEETLIKLLRTYGIEGWRKEGYPGVWLDHQGRTWKIAAIGARASKMISSHGLALNVNTNMDHFRLIVPCGITQYEPISMEKVLGKKLDIKEVYSTFEQLFETIFEMRLKKITEEELEKRIKENA